MARAAANAVFPLLALTVVGVLASVASCGMSTPSPPAAGSGSDASVATSASASGDSWIPLRSQSPTDILAAARSSQLSQQSQANGGDGAPDLSRLGTPVLVQALRPTGISTDQLADFYVVPVLNAGGDATDAVEMALNPAHTAVQEIAIVTYSQPRSGGSISEVTQGQALQMVVSQRQVAESSMDHPYLVYFALDPQGGSNNHTGWTGGGALPADPVWLVPTATGRPYVASDDGTVYTVDQLPQAAP